jgi:hypothetical protein
MPGMTSIATDEEKYRSLRTRAPQGRVAAQTRNQFDRQIQQYESRMGKALQNVYTNCKHARQ